MQKLPIAIPSIIIVAGLSIAAYASVYLVGSGNDRKASTKFVEIIDCFECPSIPSSVPPIEDSEISVLDPGDVRQFGNGGIIKVNSTDVITIEYED